MKSRRVYEWTLDREDLEALAATAVQRAGAGDGDLEFRWSTVAPNRVVLVVVSGPDEEEEVLL